MKAKTKGKAKQADSEQPKVESRSVGRPSGYKPEYAKQAEKLCKLGATDADLAEFFGVTPRTIQNWSSRYEEFFRALKDFKDLADDRVERSLYQRALGYEYDAVKIFNANGEPLVVPYRERCPPDTTAMIFWLKNRRPDRWRDVHKHEHGGPGDFDNMTADELRNYVVREAEAMGISAPKAEAKGRSGKVRSELN